MDSQSRIGIFINSASLAQAFAEAVGDRDNFAIFQNLADFCQFVEQHKHQLECLILQENSELPTITSWLHKNGILLPAIILAEMNDTGELMDSSALESSPPLLIQACHYHIAEVPLTIPHLNEIDQIITQSINQFLQLSPACSVVAISTLATPTESYPKSALLPQQQRLTEKLKERLGYLGVYYKRNPQNFFRHLLTEEKQEFLEKLKSNYRDIVLRYFEKDDTLNQKIDEFVNLVFFADIPVAQVVEIHMDLMDEFSKQLKLEGRSEEILLDYRLTLIDTIAHLCEMYRRSIPRES